jgi:hypothetical protein
MISRTGQITADAGNGEFCCAGIPYNSLKMLTFTLGISFFLIK